MSNQPTHRLYSVDHYVDAEGGSKGRWTELGVGFRHKDGKGFDLIVKQLPMSFFGEGRLVMREAEPKKQTGKSRS